MANGQVLSDQLVSDLGLDRMGAACREGWTTAEEAAFDRGMHRLRKRFADVRRILIPSKTHKEIVEYYYNVWLTKSTERARSHIVSRQKRKVRQRSPAAGNTDSPPLSPRLSVSPVGLLALPATLLSILQLLLAVLFWRCITGLRWAFPITHKFSISSCPHTGLLLHLSVPALLVSSTAGRGESSCECREEEQHFHECRPSLAFMHCFEQAQDSMPCHRACFQHKQHRVGVTPP